MVKVLEDADLTKKAGGVCDVLKGVRHLFDGDVALCAILLCPDCRAVCSHKLVNQKQS